jgi:hypothetical protein
MHKQALLTLRRYTFWQITCDWRKEGEIEWNYEMYDEEQFRIRFRLTKDGFWEILNIIGPAISGDNGRSNPIPIAIHYFEYWRM